MGLTAVLARAPMLIRKSKPSCCQLSKHFSLVSPFGYSKRQLPVSSSATA
ncbi:hypothetical protein SeseC_02142 [Streptococcus equi subsp. zooepidemicus ATCC 35246]|nr:hypothetical protein SeseC_02142 [Streptococcus equi subsp. zooepidemicus ATCC 35246]